MPLIGLGLVLLAIGAVALLTRDGGPSKGLSDGRTEASDEGVASPTTPSFRFTNSSQELVRTSLKRVDRRHRRAGFRAAAAAEDVLTDLYTEGFLDPANWGPGRYGEAFHGFTRRARERAEARPALLTAGRQAGDRFEQILPRSGRIATRVLLDREGVPTLLVSTVRFAAIASGPDPVTLRSSGQFFFERFGGSWKIVSFHVTRHDTPGEAA
jgi:hypothetical protein